MRSRYLSILMILCIIPCFCFSQNLRKLQTQKYQQGVKKLESPVVPTQELTFPISLPLVFHIIYPKGSSTFSNEDIQWQIDQLNKHFSLAEFNEKRAKYGASKFDHLAADTEIRFCLGEIFFHPTDDILFKDFQSIKSDQTNGANPFFPKGNINVWVGGIAEISGFSQMPGGNWETDGIVIDRDFFGPQQYPYNEGKTLTHLMGNYLGLKEIWGDGHCMDDGIADTPIHNAPNYRNINSRQTHFSTCPGSGLEMYMNFMDNTEDTLLYMFTKGQKDHMHEVLRTTRNTLLLAQCKGFDATESIIRTNLNHDQPKLTIFPNPAIDVMNIQYQGINDERYNLTIENVLGEIIYSNRFSKNQTEQVEISSWIPGIYLIRVDDPYLSTQTFIKQ
ncbi:MAG: zinc-dependent metalloprotease [Bacteroidota bacterium]